MPNAKPFDAEVMSTPSRGLAGFAESRLLALAEDGKGELVRSLDGLVSLVQEIAAQVESVGGGPFAGYARQAASLVDELQGVLRDRPVGELLDDGRDIIRRQPTLAVGVAVVAGFIAARLFKSGAR